MNIMIETNNCRTSPDDEYDEEIMYAGWNPDVALLVYQQQCTRNHKANHRIERSCSIEQTYLPQERHPFAK